MELFGGSNGQLHYGAVNGESDNPGCLKLKLWFLLMTLPYLSAANISRVWPGSALNILILA